LRRARHHAARAGAFDVAWLPLPLIGSDAAPRAVRNVARSLRADGWVVVATTDQPADALDEAMTVLRAEAVGGSTAFRDDVRRWLDDAGVVDLVDVPTPAGFTCPVGRRAA
jgi:hypothetical protein